jgi:hypothetical protein
MLRRVGSEYTDVSEVRTASIFSLMIEAVRISETSVYYNELHGAIFQKAFIFVLVALRT